jgi:hypothetical protein
LFTPVGAPPTEPVTVSAAFATWQAAKTQAAAVTANFVFIRFMIFLIFTGFFF